MVNQWKLELKRIIPEVPVARSAGQSNADSGNEIGETYVRSQSFSSESAVKYLHVGRRKIQISPPLGEQDKSNALPQGRFYIDGALFFLSSPEISAVLS